jgi:acetyl esterase/lipase
MMPNTLQQTHTIAFGDDGRRMGELWLPKKPGAPLVILIHGGFWRAGKTLRATDALAAALTETGLAVWNIEYRAGSGHGWRATLDDVAAAIDHTAILSRQYPVRGTRPLVIGHSAGGQLALWAAARAKSGRRYPGWGPSVLPSAVISLAGICDMVEAAESGLGEDAVLDFLGGPPHERVLWYQATCPTRLLPLGVRQVIVYGADDSRVPAAMSRRYAKAAAFAGDNVELIELPRADHRALIDPDTAAGQEVVALAARIVAETDAGTGWRKWPTNDGPMWERR